MTPFQIALDRLGWTREYAARRLGRSPSLVRYWAEGSNSRGNPAEAPAWALAYVRSCLAAVDGVPVPAVGAAAEAAGAHQR